MRALIQRVESGSVSVDGNVIARIGKGLVILLGIGPEDNEEKAAYLARKISGMRIFEDAQEHMNKSVLDIEGEAVVVSQFTLYANTQKGRRPSFTHAAPPEIAEPLVEKFIELLRSRGVPTQSGKFGAHMLVNIVNDGPVTIWIEH